MSLNVSAGPFTALDERSMLAPAFTPGELAGCTEVGGPFTGLLAAEA